MADENTPNDPAALDVASASTPAPDQSAAADSSAESPTPSDQTSESVINPSLEADPWSDFGKETTEEQGKTDEKTDVKTDAPAKTEPEKTEQAKEPTTEQKSLEDQVLEESFGEKKPDEADKPDKETEDLDNLDPKEQIDLLPTARAQAWADRNAKRAEIVKDYQYSDKPIVEIASKLEELNKDRYVELAQHAAYQLVDANPEATFQRAFAVAMLRKNPYWDHTTAQIPTLDEVAAGTFNGAATPNGDAPAKPATTPLPSNIADVTKELDTTFGFDWRDPANDSEFYDTRELQLATAVRSLEAQVKADAAKLPATTPNQQTAEIESMRSELTKTVNDYRSSIEDKVLPWIAKNTGLEVAKDDTPEIAAFKENLMLHYRGTDYQRANNLPSDFEAFATNESTVAKQLEEVYTRIVDTQLKETQARVAGNTANQQKYHAEAEAERVAVIMLLSNAHKEFKAKRIDPHLAVIGKLSTSLTTKSQEASQRVEVVSNGGDASSSPAPRKDYATADDVWDGMVKESEEAERLRAAG